MDKIKTKGLGNEKVVSVVSDNKKAAINEPGYSFGLFEINKSTIKEFIFLKNKRRVVEAQVKSILKLLKNGRHFESPIVVDRKFNSFRVIDGTHRLVAIQRMIDVDENFKITILLISYPALDDDSEIAVFRKWNVGRAQTMDDFIQSIADRVEFIQLVRNDFPIEVTIYKKRSSISFRQLINCMVCAEKRIIQGTGLNKSNFIAILSSINDENYKRLKDWINAYKGIFGEPSTRNPYYSSGFLNAMTYVYYNYFEDGITDRIKKKILGDEELLEIAVSTNRVANERLIKKIMMKLGIMKLDL